jgi:N-acetylneuraminate synthase/sialic acid synthase
LKTTPLLEHVARIGKPVILSTGGASLDDVRRAADTILPLNSQLCVLQCTAGYPAKFEELDLRVIETFRREFPESVIGLSSHDNGIAMAVAAYLLGARVIEKHFTMNRAWKGTDHAFSLEPTGLRKMVRDLERTRVALGDGVKKVHASERAPLQKMGKTLVAARALAAGTVLGPEDVAMKSPGGAGLAPYHWDDVIGATLTAALPEDGPITFEVLERKA